MSIDLKSESDCWHVANNYHSHGDIDTAMEICSSELCAGIVECQIYLGWAFYRQDDLQHAIHWFSRAAARGDANALYGMACVRYAENQYPEALTYFKDAAERGCTRAFHWIGYHYHKGLGVPVDLDKAFSFYKKGASSGFLIAQHALIRLTFQSASFLNKVLILPKYFFLLLKTAAISRNDSDPRFSDFLLLGPSINYTHDQKELKNKWGHK